MTLDNDFKNINLIVKNKYSRLGISNEQLELLINKKIKQIIKCKQFDDYNSFEKFINDNIEETIDSCILEQLQHSDKFINRYIEQYFEDTSDYKQNLEKLKNMSDLFGKVSFEPNVIFNINLLKNCKLNNVIKRVVDVNIDLIKDSNDYNIVEDKFTNILIETYCMVNNINTEDVDRRLKKIKDNYIDNNSFIYDENILKTYTHQVANMPCLKSDEEKRLFYLFALGNLESRDMIIMCNLKLSIYFANRYISYDLPLIDLIQEGNIGLMEAVERFDISKGYRFSTYASAWINKKIRLATMNLGKMIRLPGPVYHLLNNIKKTINELVNDIDRKMIIKLAENFNISIEEVELLLLVSQNIMSLDESFSENSYNNDMNNENLEVFLMSDTNIEKDYEDKSLIDDLHTILSSDLFTDREREILKMRFGFDDDIPKKLCEIGEKFNLSRERIRIILKKIMIKLENSDDVKNLKYYL